MQFQQEELQEIETADPELDRIAAETELSEVQRQINVLEMMEIPERERPKNAKRRERLWSKKREILARMNNEPVRQIGWEKIAGGR